MPTYTPHYLLQMVGTVGTAIPEIWSCGIRLWADDWTTFNEVDYCNGVAKDACSAWVARATSKISSRAKLTKVKFNFIDASGHYADPNNTLEYVYPTPIAGGAGTGGNPYQAAVCLTWRSNERARGLASRGRIYSPAPTVQTTEATGLFGEADAQGIADSAALFLNTLDVTFGVSLFLRPHIMSPVDGSHSQIDWVTVDNKIDTQRSRARALVAVKKHAAVTY